MKELILKSLKHHKYGLQALRKIHNIDALLIPTSLLHVALSAAFPYVELYLKAFMMDGTAGRGFFPQPFLYFMDDCPESGFGCAD